MTAMYKIASTQWEWIFTLKFLCCNNSYFQPTWEFMGTQKVLNLFREKRNQFFKRKYLPRNWFKLPKNWENPEYNSEDNCNDRQHQLEVLVVLLVFISTNKRHTMTHISWLPTSSHIMLEAVISTFTIPLLYHALSVFVGVVVSIGIVICAHLPLAQG